MRLTVCSVRVILASLFVLAAALPVQAIVVAVPTAPVKAVHSDAIVVGKVVSINDKAEAALMPGAKTKTAYQVAVVDVSETVKGPVKDKKVRVGLPAGPSAKNFTKLVVGNEGLFFLKKHHEGDFYILPGAGSFVSDKTKTVFAGELAEAKQALKLMEDPLASLKNGDASQRLATIAVLMPVYQTAPIGATYKQENVDGDQSKLILKTLLEADWDFNKYKGANYKQNPALLFNMLSLQPKDGFQNPNKGIFAPEYAAAAKAWLGKNWQTYALRKVVVTSDQMGASD